MTNLDPNANAARSEVPNVGRDAPNVQSPPAPLTSKLSTPGGLSNSVGGAKRVEATPSQRAPSGGDAKRDERSQTPSFGGRPSVSGRDDSTAIGSAQKASSDKSNGDMRGSNEALKCLLECVEQIVKELPRGSAAKWDGVVAQVARARAAYDSSCCTPSSDRTQDDRRNVSDHGSPKLKASPGSAASNEIDRNNASQQSANSFGR